MNITVLIVEDEINSRQFIGDLLREHGYEVIEAATLEEGRKCIQKGECDAVLLDVELPDGHGPNLLYETARLPNNPPVILITGRGNIEMAVDAMKNGAYDFLTKPIVFERLLQSLHRVREVITMRRELDHLRQTQHQEIQFIVGESPKMKSIVAQAERAAAASVSLLITGETGTGKDVLARYIHSIGQRSSKPLIAVNCAAIQSTMIEEELFGHEKGVFTSADARKHGLMEVADGGILFLDEISSMQADSQGKLLRAIEDQRIRRVGGIKDFQVDVQIVAASNRNLPSMIEMGTFREDLYYRLKVVDLDLPPLRERKGDIPELVGFFIRQKNPRLGSNIMDVTPKALEALGAYSWPGNIRELSNAIERAMLFCDDATIDLQHLPADLLRSV